MQTITVTIPENTTTAMGHGREASSCTRVETGAPDSFEISLWLRKGDRLPTVGEPTGIYRDGATLHALGVPRDTQYRVAIYWGGAMLGTGVWARRGETFAIYADAKRVSEALAREYRQVAGDTPIVEIEIV